jgi:hypothetical protein
MIFRHIRGGATLQAAYAFLARFFGPASIATATLIRRVDSSAKPRFCAHVTEAFQTQMVQMIHH